jgi:uncharacterized membrane protein
MIDYILGMWTLMPFEILVILVVLSIPVFLIVTFLRSILRNKKENIRLRLEVGKLADELEKVRKQKSAERDDSKSGLD